MSVLFVIWSVSSFVFEVPSGAWADTRDPRRVLATSGACTGMGFACWMWWPSSVGFATGFVLWALGSAMVSGTFEAYAYGSLDALGLADRYPGFIGRAHALAQIATLVAIAAGGPLFALGGFGLAGLASIAVCATTVPLALALPPAPSSADTDTDTDTGGREPGYLATLRDGLAEARHHRAVRRALVVASLAVGLTAFDEYFALAARDHGATAQIIPLLVAVTTVGQVIGTALAGRATRLDPRVLGSMYAGGGALLAVGALRGGWLGFALMGAGYGLLNNVMLVSEARLQTLIRSRARATVTSVSGVGTETVALVIYAAFGVGAMWWATASLLASAVLPAAAIGALIGRSTPSPR